MSASRVDAWFALKVKARHEKAVAAALRAKGYTEFLPLYEKQHVSSHHPRTTQLPLFPTYLFCRLDPANRLPILKTPGVFSVVGTGNTPTPVSELEIQSVRSVIASGLPVTPNEYVNVGQQVYLQAGPLRGLSGVVLGAKGVYRFVVSVTLLQRSIAVEIEGDWISNPFRPIERPTDHISARALSARA